jgi:hypothetical protein
MRGRPTSNPTWTSTAGSTSRATPTATRRKIEPKKPVVYFGSFQDLLGRDAAGNIKPKNEWLHKVNWDLVVFDEYHFGAWRETAKELFEGEEEAVAKKEAKLEYAAGLEEVNEDFASFRRRRPSSCPSPPRPTSTSPARRSGRWPRASSSRSRSSTGPTPTSSAPRRSFAARTPASGTLRRAAADAPADLPDAGRTAGDRQRRGVRRVRSQRVLRGLGHGRAGAVQAQERRAEVAGHHPRRVRAQGGRASEDRHAAAVSVLGRAPAALPAALVLVPAQRRGLPRDGEPAGREAQRLLARLRGGRRRRRVGGHRAGRAAARAQGHRQRLRDQDHHALVRQAHHRRHRAAVVVHPDAAQPQVAGDLLPGRVPRAVAVVHQEPQRRRPERGGDPQAGLLRVRLRAHARAAAALRVRHRPVAPTSRTRRTRSRTSCRSCPCWPTTART